MEDIIIPREAIGCDVGKIMDEENLTIPELIKELKQKIKAKETKFFAHQGKVEDEREVEALNIQIEALDMALKLRSMYPAKTVKVGNDGDEPFRVEEVGAAKEFIASEITRLIAGAEAAKVLGQADRPTGEAPEV